MSRILGLDLGEKRIGVAVADSDGIALPLTTLRRAASPAEDATAIARLLAEQGATEIIVGLPYEAAGHEGGQARITRDWVAGVQGLLPAPLRYRDERLTQPSRRAAARSHEARPLRRAAEPDPARRLPGPGRPRSRGDHPPGRARRSNRRTTHRAVAPATQTTRPDPRYGGPPMTIRSGGRARERSQARPAEPGTYDDAWQPEYVTDTRGSGRGGGRSQRRLQRLGQRPRSARDPGDHQVPVVRADPRRHRDHPARSPRCGR